MSYIRYFFDEILSYNDFMAIIGTILALILVVCAVNLLLFSNLARLCRANKAVNKFFKTNSHINRYNRALFNRAVVKRMPRKVRKVWVESAVFYQNYCSDSFASQIRQASKHGGNSTFVTYVFSYIAALIIILVGLIAVGGEDYYAALVASSGIFGGAVGLLILAIELYYLDKHAEQKTESLISELKSRVTKTNSNSLECDSKSGNISSKDGFLDSLKKVYTRDFQVSALGTPENNLNAQSSAITDKVQQDRKDNITANSDNCVESVRCLESNSADDFDLLIAKDKLNNPQSAECLLSQSADTKDNSCVNIENLINYESALSKGANPICATGLNSVLDVAIPDESSGRSDKIADLEKLINNLISDGSSEMLLTEVYDAISELTEYNYTSSLELAKLRILLKRLKTAI